MLRPLRLLLIEDDENDVFLILRELRAGGYAPEWTRVDTEGGLSEALGRGGWEVITCDWVMPRLDAPAALRVLRAHGTEAPIIVVSGQVGEEYAVSAMKSGAHDFVSKGRLARLCPAIERELDECAVRRARRAAEQALQESQRRYRDLVERAHDIVYAHELDGTITAVNRAGLEVGGYTAAEVIGANFLQFVAPEHRQLAQQPRGPDISPGVSVNYEIDLLTRDGRRVPVEIRSWRAVENGRPVRVEGIARDIRERREASDRLRQAERQYRALVEQVPAISYTYSLTRPLRLRYVSPQVTTLLGVSPAAWVEEGTWFDHLHPEDRGRVIASYAGVLDRSAPLVLEYRLLARDGSVRTISDHSTIVRDDDGAPLYVQGVMLDVSERCRAEEALRASSAQLLAVSEDRAAQLAARQEAEMALQGSEQQRIRELLALAQGAGAGSIDERLSGLCRSAVDLIGCDRSSLFLLDDRYYRARYNFGNPPDIAALFPRFRVRTDDPLVTRAVERRGPVTLNDAQHAALMNEQTARAARISSIIVAPLLGDADEPLGFLTAEYNENPGAFPSLNEILIAGIAKLAALMVLAERRERERQLAEAAVQELNATLERRVEERTAELQAANRELETFSYSVSHDLRAPLRRIDGWSAAILEDCAGRLDAAGEHHLGRIRAEVGRMARLIDDLLQLAQVGRQPLRIDSVDLAAMVAELVQELRAQEPGRRVEVIIAPELRAAADEAMLSRALENLLANAWKYTRGQAAAQIEFGVLEHEPVATYFVRDNGVGFDMGEAGRLFAAFERLHPAAEFEGNGIGLAIAGRAINRHGGRIWAEAQVGAGATFYFTLGGSGPTPAHGETGGGG